MAGDFEIGGDILKLSFDKNTQEFCVNRDDLSLGGKGKRYFTVSVKEKLHLDIYIDTSVMEIYYQDGEAVATSCYYAKEKLSAIPFKTNIPTSITVSQLNSIEFN